MRRPLVVSVAMMMAVGQQWLPLRIIAASPRHAAAASWAGSQDRDEGTNPEAVCTMTRAQHAARTTARIDVIA